MSEERDSLLQTEYSALRDEVATGLDAIRQLEVGALAGVGALLAWLATHADAPPQGWLLPFALVVAAALRAFGTYKSVRLVGNFLRKKEVALAGGETRWETWRSQRSSGQIVIGSCFWGALGGITIVAAIWGYEWTHAGSSSKPGITLECSAIPDSGSGVVLRCLPLEH